LRGGGEGLVLQALMSTRRHSFNPHLRDVDPEAPARAVGWDPESLRCTIESLPRVDFGVDLPEFHDHPMSAMEEGGGSGLVDCPEEVMLRICCQLEDPRDVARFASTCKAMRSIAYNHCPGLRDTMLMRHQMAVSKAIGRAPHNVLLIFDEPGTGKTLSVISYILRTRGRLPPFPVDASLEITDLWGTEARQPLGYK